MKNKEEEEEESLYYRIWETKLLGNQVVGTIIFKFFIFERTRFVLERHITKLSLWIESRRINLSHHCPGLINYIFFQTLDSFGV